MSYAFMAEDPPPPRRGRINWALIGAIVVVAGLLAAVLLRPANVSERQRNDRTVRVVLPPPPPPPPPPPEVAQVKPPEPVPTPVPAEQPQDTPPPEAKSEPAPGDNALTAREGAGPSNYGLARGDGSGVRIGGKPGGGGDAFAAYGELTRVAVQRAIQADPVLSRGRYSGRLEIAVDAEGRVIRVSLMQSGGDSRRDARLTQILNGLQLSQRPPAGLRPMRMEINTRAVG